MIIRDVSDISGAPLGNGLAVAIFNDLVTTRDHSKLDNRDSPNQHSIESITGLREELDNCTAKVFNAAAGRLIVAQEDGSLECSSIHKDDILLRNFADETYATKDFVETISSEIIQESVVISKSGETVVKVPDKLVGYKNLFVYHNGNLLVKDMHYLRDEHQDHIALINHVAYVSDVFTFMYLGRVTSKSDTYHEHSNFDILNRVTQEMVDCWSESPGYLTDVVVNGVLVESSDHKVELKIPVKPADIGAAEEHHEHIEYLPKNSIFDSNGLIKAALIPSDATGSLKLGQTFDTAFRGDWGLAAYEHALERHAPVMAQENVIEVFRTASDILPVVNKTVIIPVATKETYGVVKSSDEDGKVRVNADGTMTMNRMSLSNLTVSEGEELVLVAGDSKGINKN